MQKQIRIRAFSLIEVIIVVIILGMIIAFAIPTYVKTIEKAKAQKAANNLLLIQVEEKRYFHRNGEYAYDKVAGDGKAFKTMNMENFNSNPARSFDYSISEYLPDSPNFEAKAKRKSDTGQPYKDHEYIVHKDGLVTGPLL